MRRQWAFRAANISASVDNYEKISEEEEAQLAALVAEVNAAIPKMHASLDRSIETLRQLHEEMDAFFREKGIRKGVRSATLSRR